MTKHANPLENVRVAAPCPADWGKMVGDERVRFCGQCELNVYNLSGMTRREAEALVAGTEGRLCVRFYRRADGTVLTRNCPVGLRAIRRKVSRVAGAAFSAALGFFAGLGLDFGFRPGAVESRHAVGVLVASPEQRRDVPDITPLMGAILSNVNMTGPGGVKEDDGRRRQHRLK